MSRKVTCVYEYLLQETNERLNNWLKHTKKSLIFCTKYSLNGDKFVQYIDRLKIQFRKRIKRYNFMMNVGDK